MENGIIATISDYMKLIENKYKEIRIRNENQLLLFRGQNVDKPLLPRLAREIEASKTYVYPKLYGFHTIEKMMLDEFIRRARILLGKELETIWDWLSHAQHHGMSTSLLDWTENPLIALFFSIINQRHNDKSIVWILRVDKKDIIVPNKKTNPFEIENTKVFRPNLISSDISRRMISQSGWFTVHKYLRIEDKFVPLEKNKRFKNNLIKLIIKENHSYWLEHLNICGINSATLFPDLDGLCEYINWRRIIDNTRYIRLPQSKVVDRKVNEYME